MRTLAEVPRRAAILWGRRKALMFQRSSVSFAELADRIDRLAAALARRVSPGERVALLMENRPEYLSCYYAVPASQGVLVPVNVFLSPAEMRAIVRDSGASIAVVSAGILARGTETLDDLPDLRDVLIVPSPGSSGPRHPSISGARCLTLEQALAESSRDPAPTPPGEDVAERTALLVYTSGTTGTPKGVMLSHRNLLSNARSCIQGVGVTPRDRVLLFLPMFHSFTSMVAMLAPLVSGMGIVLCERVDRAEIRRAITRWRPTIMPGVPAVFTAMSQARVGRLSRLLNPVRLYISGGAPLPLETLNSFEQYYRRPLCEGYGLSEASPVVSINPPGGPRKPGSVGRPLPGVRVLVRDREGRDAAAGETGEICVQADSVMQGYFRRGDETASALRDGVLHTGDLGRLDSDGFIFIEGRLKDMLIYRGMNVYPREIEVVLESHPDVKEAAVIGIPAGARGEVPYAFVVPMEGRPLAESDLRRTCLAQLARYKVPRTFRVVSELPRNAAGKVAKMQLKERVLTAGV
ncbi:MAG: class I adenylate-forming enzyme family protein [Candidatus Polarisedimenticolia bacterium]